MAVTQANLNTVLAAAEGGVAATGTLTVTSNPSAADKFTVNGTDVVFVASGATGNQVNIGVDANTTTASLQAFLAASSDANISKALYTVSTNVVTVTYKVPGTVGNAFTLAKTGSTIAVSAATLASGSNSAATEFAPVSAGGLVAETAEDSTFEKAVLAVAASVDFCMRNTVDPSVSAANFTLARQQRRLLKDMLSDLTSIITPAGSSTVDDRGTQADIVKIKVLKKYNKRAANVTIN